MLVGEPQVWPLEKSTNRFEPTLVFPFAVYFAEAMAARIFALRFDQFLIEKRAGGTFAFVDLTGRYRDTSLRDQFRPGKTLKLRLREMLRRLRRRGGDVE